MNDRPDELKKMIAEQQPPEIPDISDELTQIWKCLLEKDPMRRFSISDVIIHFRSV